MVCDQETSLVGHRHMADSTTPVTVLLFSGLFMERLIQVCMIRLPKGVIATSVSLKCWLPKGIPIMVK